MPAPTLVLMMLVGSVVLVGAPGLVYRAGANTPSSTHIQLLMYKTQGSLPVAPRAKLLEVYALFLGVQCPQS